MKSRGLKYRKRRFSHPNFIFYFFKSCSEAFHRSIHQPWKLPLDYKRKVIGPVILPQIGFEFVYILTFTQRTKKSGKRESNWFSAGMAPCDVADCKPSSCCRSINKLSENRTEKLRKR